MYNQLTTMWLSYIADFALLLASISFAGLFVATNPAGSSVRIDDGGGLDNMGGGGPGPPI